MRLTSKMMHSNMLRNLQSGMQRMERFNKQLATDRTIQLPSDDPVVAGTIMRLQANIAETDQLKRNVDHAVSWVDSSESVFGEVSAIVLRVKELTVYGLSDTLPTDAREAIAREVEQIYENLIQLGNSMHEGKYLFSGQKTITQPFQIPEAIPGERILVTPHYLGDDASLRVEVGAGSTIAINVDGESAFRTVFDAVVSTHTYLRKLSELEELGDEEKIDELQKEDLRALGNQSLKLIDTAVDTLVTIRSDMGARANRLDLSQSRLGDLGINLRRLLGRSADVDVSEAIMNLKAEETVYRTALSVGARIIQPSLVDFLR